MIEKDSFELVQQYISGWKKNNIHLITSCLAENCVVIESHGPTYYGIPEIEKWFKFWLEAKSVVLKWDVTSFVFCEKNKPHFANGISHVFQIMLNIL